MDKLNVLIVDDSVVYRRILMTAVENTRMASMIQSASNGILALERLQQSEYDVVLMDVNMPEMDGIEALKRMKSARPQIQVIMISSKGGKNAAVTLECLQLGAMDFIVKPVDNDYDSNMMFVQQQLKILFTQVLLMRMNTAKPTAVTAVAGNPAVALITPDKSVRTRLSGIDLVLIASSTGGPSALEKLLTGISSEFLTPILIVQHMPADFTKALSDNLDNKCQLKVIEGSEEDIIRAGQIIIAPGGRHMVLKKVEHSMKKVGITDTEPVNGVRPAADVLFRSVAKEFSGARILAIILTGMGVDGRDGVSALKQSCSCYCIAQSEATSVVFGMPGSVVNAGLCDEVLDIGKIADRMLDIRKYGS